jgi:riboflavin kinase/FMN adenylyltransferase
MRVIRDADGELAAPRGAVATVGNYDGIHLGQRAVLERVVARARQLARPALAITFEPHPLRVLAPERAPRRLTTDLQRLRLLEGLGLDALCVLDFTPELASWPAERFVRELLAGRLALHELYVGSRFAFGRGRSGSLALLERLGAELGFRAFGVPEVEVRGEPVSATRIRSALAAGRVEDAAELLGRPYAVDGRVVEGDRRGRTLGFPTLNLATRNEILPADGVYVTAAEFPERGERAPGVANVGLRPTIGRDAAPVVEAHLLGFGRECYGEEVELRFLARLRGERRFPSLAALTEQIARDVGSAREYFAAAGRSDRRSAGAGAPAGPRGGASSP